MKRSVEAGQLETIDCKTIIDGLRVRRAGELNFSVVQRFVDEIVALPDREIFEAMIWVMERCKLVVEGAAAAPVGALLHGLVKLPAGSQVVGGAVGRQPESRSAARTELELSQRGAAFAILTRHRGSARSPDRRRMHGLSPAHRR